MARLFRLGLDGRACQIGVGVARNLRALLLMTALAYANVCDAPPGAAQSRLPSPLVYLRDVDASILQDIKYATRDNFTGVPVDGYEAGECILLQRVADALREVQADLKNRNLSLKVYDCYRPQRAVRAFMKWAKQLKGGEAATKRFHPNIPRQSLVSLGYISAASGHSRADTVDLTLVAIPAKNVAAFDASQTYGACTAPADKREPDNSIDMGTGFDCFDAKSQTSSTAITREQRSWRQTLVRAMQYRGFRNYSREWWHFTYGTTTGPAYDIPITRNHMHLSR
jgi:zinc D-Ala-D-Ala dipeptidase